MIVWLASYPRSGNSLFANLLKHHTGTHLYSIYEDFDLDTYTYLNVDQLQFAKKSQDVYFVKTHEMPIDNLAAIYIVRDGRDVITSYAHYIIDKQINLPDTPPENLLQWALNALINSPDQFSGWGKHVSAWTRRTANTYVIRYEDLIQPRNQLKIVKSTIKKLGINNTPITNKTLLPDFSNYSNKNNLFYRKGRTNTWMTEMTPEIHIKFWEQYGNTMHQFGYRNNNEENSIRMEYLAAKYFQDTGTIQRAQTELLNQLISTQGKIVGELVEACTQLQQAQSQVEVLEKEKEEIATQNHLLLQQTESLQENLSAQQKILSIKDQELIDKENVIQSFRNSFSYTFANGPFRHLPVFKKTHQIADHWKTRLKSVTRYYFSPRLGVLNQFPPKVCDIPARYFYVKVLIQPAPMISIVTPTYNYGHFLERTIKSVIYQRYPRLEYIVQDGGSADDTAKIIEKYKNHITHFESREDNGQSHALNLGFQNTTGEVMAYLNADDVFLPGTLDYISNYFSTHPNVDVVYGHRLIINEEDLIIGEWVMPPHDNNALRWADFIPQETLFWRRRIWDKIGGVINETLQFAMDWDLLLRFQEGGATIKRLPRFLSAFRVHPTQKTSALITQTGEREVTGLRQRSFGRTVDSNEIKKNIRFFLLCSILFHWLYKLNLKAMKLMDRFTKDEERLILYEPESIYFYSLHKAGTSLFTHILRNTTELTHIDYETMLFDNAHTGQCIYQKHNYIYGVFRIQEPNQSRIYSEILKNVSRKEFAAGKTAIFFIRDPRDILVSLYYSMGRSHVTSPNPQIANELQVFRKNMSALSIDEFVIRDIPKILKRFEILYDLSRACKRHVILKYEDLINDFEGFMRDLSKYITIPDEIKEEIHIASRPNKIEDLLAHKRSGQIGQYKTKLKAETILELNRALKPILEKFGYDKD